MNKEEWKKVRLGEVVSTINGLWTGKKEPFVNVGVIRNTNFTKDCELDLTNLAYLDVEAKQYTTRKLLPGDIIIEKSGGSEKQPVGRPVLFEETEGEFSFSNFTSVIRIISQEEVLPKYLHWCLKGKYYKGETYKLQSKTTGLHNLDFKGFLRLEIPLPPLSVQREIVSELDLLSTIISKKRVQLAELDRLAAATFHQTFGDPIENPKHWPIKKLGELIKVIGGFAFKSDSYSVSGIPVLRIGNINSGFLKEENLCFYEEDVSLKKFLVFPNELVMSLTGTVGKDDYGNVCVLPNTYEKYYLNQRNAKFVLGEFLETRYIQHLFLNKEIKRKLTGNSRGVRQANISNRDIENLEIPLPPLSLQQTFASKISSIEHQKELIKKSVAEVQTLLDATMDKWFS